MENRIVLKFDKAATRLAGNPFGRATYEQQVKDSIHFDERNVIVFPTQIEKIASSFTQGFFEEIVKKVGYAHFRDVIRVEAGNDELVSVMYSDLLP